MSIHAQITDEAKQKLAQQKRSSTISSIVVALLTCTLIAIILMIIAMSVNVKTTPELIPFGTSSIEEDVIEKPEITNEVERKPSSPSSSMTRTIVANTTSAISIPTVDVEVTELSMEFGNGDDFGDGDFGDGSGSGAGGGGRSTFMGKVGGAGLTGTFYDLKQTNKKKTNKIGKAYAES